MTEIRTHRELYGTEPRAGVYEWDAGNTKPTDFPGGRWSVRLTEAGEWEVFFHPFSFNSQGQPDDVLATFGRGEEAERQAKAYALGLVDQAWGRE